MFSILLLVIIYISFISLGLPDSLLGAAWPSMYSTLNVPMHYAGFISMVITGATVVSAVFSEKVIRRFGTGIVTAVSVLTTAVSLIGFSISNSIYMLCFFAVPLGLGAGSVDAGLNNYVALHHKARHMSWLHCFWGIGTTIGPLIMASFLLNMNSWNMGYRTIGLMQFCLVVILFISLPLWKKPVENSVKSESVKFSKLFSITGVKEVLTAFFLYCSIEMTSGLWGASYLVMERGFPPEIAAQWTALFFFGITAGRFITGFITIKLNNRRIIRLGQAIIGCAVIIIVLPFENFALAGLFMIGLGCAPIFPCLIHETPVSFGREYSQAIIGLQMACAYIGTSVMPPLFGWIASYLSFSIFPVFIGIILLLQITAVETLNWKIKKKSREQ